MSVTRVIPVDPREPSAAAVAEAASLVAGGGIIGFPTETVYGLAALITQPAAVARLRQLKERPREKQFTICIHSAAQAQRYAETVPPVAQLLMNAFWPGPLTLVLPAGESATVGLRVPSHPVAQMLLRQLTSPVFAPSANRAGGQEPRTARQVLEVFDRKIDAVLDAGPAPRGISSTVCRVDGAKIEILRPGAIAEEDIRRAAAQITILFVCTGNTCRSPMAEGLLRAAAKDNPRLRVMSAGIAAMDGLPASEYAQRAMAAYHIDISGHRARALTEEMIQTADYILVMEEAQRRHIIHCVPAAAARVHVLTQFAADGEPRDVMDPIGQGPEVYAQTAQLLNRLIERVVQQLI